MENENLRWDCDKDGCYKQLCLPKWHVLNDSLDPCKMTDLDGMVERRGKFLVVEWKAPGQSVKNAQERALNALNRLDQFTVLVVHGTSDPMDPKMVRFPFGPDKATDLERFQKGVHDWFAKASIRQRRDGT